MLKINNYLIEEENIFIDKIQNPICNTKKCYFGNMPNDGGNFLITEKDRNQMTLMYPSSEKIIKRYIGAEDFLNGGEKRYCLWLKDVNKEEWIHIEPIRNRVEAVAEFRLASTAKPTRDKAKTPELFFFAPHTGEPYLLIPSVSSERRRYIPIGFMSGDVISSNLNLIVIGAELYDFGILTSAMHMAWMRTVCGRLEMRYRYSASIVYNTFPWPTVSEEQKKAVSELADMVLNIRNMYPDKTLAEMYDPDKMPEPLAEAHHNLDVAVDSLYRNTPFESDEERLQLLFKLYEKLVVAKNAKEKPHA